MKFTTRNQHLFIAWEHLVPETLRSNNPRHLIFGVQKSGTSVIANTLAYCSKQSLTMDHKSLWPILETPKSERFKFIVRQFRRHPITLGSTFLKEPCMTLCPEMFVQFGAEKYLLVIRNPLQTARSILDRLGVPIDAETIDLDSIPPAWRGLFTHSSNSETPFIRLIEYWRMCMENDFWSRPNAIIIQYEDFIRNPEDEVASILNRLNMTKKRPASHIINAQVQPLGANRERDVADMLPNDILQKALRISSDIYSKLKLS